MEKTYDIFGIETDSSIQREADEKKRACYEQRLKIIDGDILTQLHNYSMLDTMACYKTKASKKQFIVNYLMSKIPDIRKGPDSRGKQDFAYREEYKNKPVDKTMCEKMADYVLDTYKHEDGVMYYHKPAGHDSYYVLDKNGNNVNRVRYENNDLKIQYLEALIRERYPYPEYKEFYYDGGNKVYTPHATKELNNEAWDLAKKDPKYVKLEEVD